jgi:hypothetical protein
MEEKSVKMPLSQKLIYLGGVGLPVGTLLELLGFGGPGLILAGIAGGAAAFFSEEIRAALPGGNEQRSSSSSLPDRVQWLVTGNKPAQQEVGQEPAAGNLEEMEELPLKPVERLNLGIDDEELAAPKQNRTSMFLLSEVLGAFRPSLDKIYIGTLATGEMVFCRAKDLCHVALAGATRGGKSSLMRMLLAQLCSAGARVLILNPHYSRFIRDGQEDWTPFDPYLIHDPMECRKYEVIEHYLRLVAEDLLPKRLDKFAHSLAVGEPYFLALDELPSIVRKIKNAPEYLEVILREGAKVGIFLITAAQDFLVKTISPSGSGGAVRECYRSVYYVGGDATTAKILLDMPASQIPEEHMGRGTVMLRNWIVCKKSSVASVPYVDNDALYKLLGPSTYVSGANQARPDEDDLVSSLMTSRIVQTEDLPIVEQVTTRTYQSVSQLRRARRAQRLNGGGSQSAEPVTRPERAVSAEDGLSSEERKVVEAYRNGHATGNAIAAATDIPATRVNQILHKLGKSGSGLIDWKPRTRV